MAKVQNVKLRRNLEVTEIDGEKVMMDFDLGKYLMIKGAGNDIWDMITEKKEISVETIINNLLEKYQVDRETCKSSVLEFLENLESNHIILLD